MMVIYNILLKLNYVTVTYYVKLLLYVIMLCLLCYYVFMSLIVHYLECSYYMRLYLLEFFTIIVYSYTCFCCLGISIIFPPHHFSVPFSIPF